MRFSAESGWIAAVVKNARHHLQMALVFFCFLLGSPALLQAQEAQQIEGSSLQKNAILYLLSLLILMLGLIVVLRPVDRQREKERKYVKKKKEDS